MFLKNIACPKEAMEIYISYDDEKQIIRDAFPIDLYGEDVFAVSYKAQVRGVIHGRTQFSKIAIDLSQATFDNKQPLDVGRSSNNRVR